MVTQGSASAPRGSDRDIFPAQIVSRRLLRKLVIFSQLLTGAAQNAGTVSAAPRF